MANAYPSESVQGVLLGANDEWWARDEKPALCRGRLIRAFLPHVDQIPMKLVIAGRDEPTDHFKARFRIEPLRIKDPEATVKLPVAALPQYPGEALIVQRGKKRPAIILALGGPEVPPAVRQGGAKWQSAPTMLVAPYYGGDQDGSRGGWNPTFLERIRRVEYPQYMADRLPIGGVEESVLRLDHIQPVGRHHDSVEQTPFRLSDLALVIVDEWLEWLRTGKLEANQELAEVRKLLLEGLNGA